MLGIVLLAGIMACHAPKSTRGDHTLNKSRVSRDIRSTTSRDDDISPSGRGHSDNGRFLDALESPETKSADSDAKAVSSTVSSLDRKAVKASAALTSANIILMESEKLLGTRYRYAGDSPSLGFDCSGLTSYLYRKAGIDLPRTSTAQSRIGRRKKFEQAEVGDLVFFGTGSRVTHVAVVLERSRSTMQIVHSTSSKGVRYDEVFSSKYWSSRKLWAVDIDSLTE